MSSRGLGVSAEAVALAEPVTLVTALEKQMPMMVVSENHQWEEREVIWGRREKESEGGLSERKGRERLGKEGGRRV